MSLCDEANWLRGRIVELQHALREKREFPAGRYTAAKPWLLPFPPEIDEHPYFGKWDGFPDPDASGECDSWNVRYDDVGRWKIRCELGSGHHGPHAHGAYEAYGSCKLFTWFDSNPREVRVVFVTKS